MGKEAPRRKAEGSNDILLGNVKPAISGKIYSTLTYEVCAYENQHILLIRLVILQGEIR